MEYNLYISNSWSYNNLYNELKELINSSLSYNTFSIGHKHFTDHDIDLVISGQMKSSDVVIILAGVSEYDDVVAMEVDKALKLNKPILVIEKWGAKYTGSVVKENATMVVGWDKEMIVNAIIKLSNKS